MNTELSRCPRCGGDAQLTFEAPAVELVKLALEAFTELELHRWPLVASTSLRCHRYPMCGYWAAGDYVGGVFMANDDLVPFAAILFDQATVLRRRTRDVPRQHRPQAHPGQ